MTRVAVVSPYDLVRPGGVQNQVLELAKQLKLVGHDAWVVGPGAPAHLGVDIGRSVVIPANGSRVPICLAPSAISRTRAAVASADVVHLHEPLMPIVGPALLSTSLPLVATAHAAPPSWVKPIYRMTPRRWWTGRVVTAVSAAAAAPLGRPARVIPNGLEVGAFRLPEEKRENRVVFLGRSDRRKGLEVLLHAWDRIRRESGNAELVVLGSDGPDDNGIVFRGRVSEEDKRLELARAAIYVAPNLGGESFGITLVEAMAAGCALVVSELEPFREVAGEAALYVAPGDPAVLASAVTRLLGSSSERAALAAAALARVTRFDWSVVLPQYLECYQAVAGGQQRPG
ncbi:MAG: glycosyltransferase family 4 protein [Acidimicrobiia bacterium]